MAEIMHALRAIPSIIHSRVGGGGRGWDTLHGMALINHA